jgi:butyryl-CoA dehydrogenase
MLLTQRAIAEGGLALSMECNRQFDIAHAAIGEEKHHAWLLLEILTPIVKAYGSEQSNRAASLAIQTFGGYGYTMDFPVQQFYRDLKIFTLYEGTTGIQSLDLLGRKVTMEKGKALEVLAKQIHHTIAEANKHDTLKPLAQQMHEEVKRIQEVLIHLGNFAAKGEADRMLADATVFMEMMGYIVVGWQWLKQGVVAQASLENNNSNQTKEFYESILHVMKFYFRYELPHAEACANTLLHPDYLTNLKKVQFH